MSAEGRSNKTELSTNGTTAYFSGLACGQNYSLAVAPRSQRCAASAARASTQAFVPSCRLHTSAGGKKGEINPNRSLINLCLSGPCPPTGISTTQDCLSAIVVVTWQAGSSGLDYYYTASMQSDTGVTSVCMSDTNECSVPGLMCGHNFTVSVTASNSVCNATAAEATDLQSGNTLAGTHTMT